MLHSFKATLVHALHHIVYLLVLVKWIVSRSKLSCKLRIHKLGLIWIHEHLWLHQHAHRLLILGWKLGLGRRLVCILVVKASLVHTGIVHSYIVEHLLLLLMLLYKERIGWKRQFIRLGISTASITRRPPSSSTTLALEMWDLPQLG